MNTDKNRKMSPIINGALKRWGKSDVRDFLEGTMKLSDTQWLLSHLFEKIVSRRTVTDVLKQRETSKFVTPSAVDQRKLNDFDNVAFSLLNSAYCCIELSPLAPLGSNSLLTKLSQGNLLPTTRMTEVVGDIAVSLAIESAAISRHQKVSNVKLATSHRITRVQDFSSIPGFTQHFKMFGLSTSGIGSSDSEDAIVEHIDFYLSLLEFLKTMWCDFTDLTVYISDISMSMKMIQTAGLSMEEVRSMTDYEEEYDLCSKSKINVERYHESLSSVSGVQYSAFAATAERIKRLQQEYSSVKILYDLGRIAGINYYNGLCFKIVATNARGQTLPLADGGFSDWSAQLLHDKKRFCVTSGIGSEMFCREFGE